MKRFYAFGGFGVVLLLFAIWKIVDNLRFLARTVAVDGKFVKWDITQPGTVGGPSGTGGRNSYRRIVAFRASDGTEHRVTATVYFRSYGAPKEATGTRYPVRYDAAHPDDARIVTFTDFWLFPLVTLVVAGVCLAIAADDWRHPSG